MSTLRTAAPVNTFEDTQTCRNLRSACLGEMHTRSTYLEAAHRMQEADLHVITHAFVFTAAQEKEHADVFRGLMTAHGGQIIPMTEDTPLLLPHSPMDILRAMAQAEHDEWDTLYPHFARQAMEEGYPRIAEAFQRIAETEHIHARRFAQYLALMADDALFDAPDRTSWLCLPCGQLHTGLAAPEQCAACGCSRGHFIRSSFYPFVVED